jgi:hypothetical protein
VDTAGPGEVSVAAEIADTSAKRPHVVLLGAGASKAALPNGDRNGVPVPLLRDVATSLELATRFPPELRDLATSDFEAAYSRLVASGADVSTLDDDIRRYFARLELPSQANLYDLLHLCLREKDAIFTFNWDPFLLQSRIRLAQVGVRGFPRLFFLHGNVLAGFCADDGISGVVGDSCRACGEPFLPSRLLFPVEQKDYDDDPFIAREWEAVRAYLGFAFILTVFGYSAPTTDVEAIDLLKEGWGTPGERNMEQMEIVNRRGADHDELHETWEPFIHSHHFEIHDSFFESSMANHPRRTGEAYFNQYWRAQFIENNPVPQDVTDLAELVEWFEPLLAVESR